MEWLNISGVKHEFSMRQRKISNCTSMVMSSKLSLAEEPVCSRYCPKKYKFMICKILADVELWLIQNLLPFVCHIYLKSVKCI